MADLDLLRAAFAAIKAARASDDDPEYSPLRYMQNELKQMLISQWIETQAIAESLQTNHDAFVTEAGARLSTKSKAALESAITVLQELLGSTDVAEADLRLVLADFLTESAAPPVVGDPPSPPASAALPLIREALPKGTTALLEHVSAIREVTPTGSDSGPVFEMLIIKEGVSKNRILYPRERLQEAPPLLEGRPLYVDHSMPNASGQVAPRSLASKGGWWSNVRWADNINSQEGACSGLVGDLNLFRPENSPVPWLAGMIRESLERGAPEQIGISIVAAAGLKLGRDSLGVLKEVTDFKLFASADAVAEPGAGGQPISLVATEGVDQEVMDLEKLTLEELRTARPDLFEALAPKDDPKPGTKTAEDKPPVASAMISEGAVTVDRKEWDTLQESIKATSQIVAVQQSSMLLEAKLAATPHLSDAVKTIIRGRFAGQIVDAAAIDAVVLEYDQVARAAFDPDHNFMPAGAIIPFGRLSEGISPLDQVMAALDDMFGTKDEKMAGKFQPIRSIREFFSQVTGDWTGDGAYDKSRSVIGQYLYEALPGASTLVGAATVTMANLLGTSINRRVQRLYAEQPKWWEPLVDIVPISNFKTQERILLHNFGSLTQRTIRGSGAGAEFTELAWGETKETYAPSLYGNIVTITRESVIDDDLRGIAAIPRLLAQSAGITINEYMAALWTANSGAGPTMSDSNPVFDAAHANYGTAAFSRANVLASRRAVMKQTNHASKRLGLIARYLLVPVDLEDQAYPILNSAQDPDSGNNAANILNSAEGGLRRMIVVPNWTNAYRYYLHCDPSQIQGIELGFLNGNQVPQLLSQTDQTSGLVYTNDVISNRVRFEFGAGWTDYRAGAGQLATS